MYQKRPKRKLSKKQKQNLKKGQEALKQWREEQRKKKNQKE